MREFELEPGEQVVMEVRKHWFLFLLELLPYAIFAIAPPALLSLAELVAPVSPFAATLSGIAPYLHALYGIWILIIWTLAWSAFTRYFLNLWVLTNQRIVDIKQRSFFNHEVSSLFLSRVQDVSTDVVGVLPSLLGIGMIVVQSAGAVEKFRMRGIPNPEKMRDLILRYVSADLKSVSSDTITATNGGI